MHMPVTFWPRSATLCYRLAHNVLCSESQVLKSESRWKKQQSEDRIALSNEGEAALHSTGGIPYLWLQLRVPEAAQWVQDSAWGGECDGARRIQPENCAGGSLLSFLQRLPTVHSKSQKRNKLQPLHGLAFFQYISQEKCQPFQTLVQSGFYQSWEPKQMLLHLSKGVRKRYN